MARLWLPSSDGEVALDQQVPLAPALLEPAVTAG
jgi:hypothetical protein